MLPNRARALSRCSISAAFEASAAVISMGKPSFARPAASRASGLRAGAEGHHISAFSSEERSSFAAMPLEAPTMRTPWPFSGQAFRSESPVR